MISRDIITTPIISPPLQRGLSGLAMPMLLIGFLASIPLVVVHSLNLWGTPYAKAFFLAYLGITLYLWNEGMARTEVPRWRYRLAWFSLISSAIVGILSFLLYAPYLGQVAFLLAFLALLSSQFTTIPLHRMLKLMLLASFLAIPSRVLTVLESEFTKNSLGLVSSALDYLELPHHVEGLSIKTPTVTFHWIEDGFGMECLYVTAITVAISWIFRNRGLLTSILEIIAIPSLAFSQTFLRFLVVLWADRLGPFDFSSGWGGFLFHLSFLGWIVLSTWLLMHWLRLAMREIPPPTNRDKTPIGAEVFNRVSRWPWPSTVALAKGSKSSASSSAKKAVDSKTGVDTEPAPEPMQSVCTYRFRFAKWAYGLIGIWAILSILSTISLLILLRMNQNSAWLEGAEAFLSTRTAEFTDDSIVFQPGKIESRPANHPVGELSKSWGHSTVNGAEIQCGLDLGDMERSSPIELYKRYGWKADDSASRKQPTDGSYPTLRMYNPLLKKHGFIIAANFDSSGNPIGFPEDANKRSTGLWGRLASTPISMLFSRIRKKSGVSIHASLICTDNFPIEESQCTELVSLFERISPKMSAIGKGALGK